LRIIVYQAFRRFAKLFSGHALRDRYPFLNSIYVDINRKLSPGKTVALGHIMFLDPDDSMGLSVNGSYESAETQIVMENIKPGEVVLDIGANIGYYTLLFARLVGPEGRVISFEPDPQSFALLKRNVQANGYQNVDLKNLAVSNIDGELTLYRDRFNNLDHRIIKSDDARRSVRVRVVRLDDLFLKENDPIHFIKMDIQGAEGLAVEGMKKLLGRNRGLKMLLEFWPGGLELSGMPPDRLLKSLADMGFVFYDLKPEGQTHEEIRWQAILNQYILKPGEHTNLLCVRG
jgi:FkbM family methyltransferase